MFRFTQCRGAYRREKTLQLFSEMLSTLLLGTRSFTGDHWFTGAGRPNPPASTSPALELNTHNITLLLIVIFFNVESGYKSQVLMFAKPVLY